MHNLNSSTKPVKQKLSFAAKFDSVLTFQQQKARFPELRGYCEKVLKLKFKGNHCFCPIHGGHSGHSFQIDDEAQKWQCWSECRERCSRHSDGQADRSQPCTCRGDVLDLHLLCFEFESKQEGITSLINGSELPKVKAGKFFLLTGKPRVKQAKSGVDEKLVAESVEGLCFCHFRLSPEQERYSESGRFRFRSNIRNILQPNDLPVVFFTKYKAIIGRRAVDALRQVPDEIQYLFAGRGRVKEEATNSAT